jgi:hypothetical protein
MVMCKTDNNHELKLYEIAEILGVSVKELLIDNDPTAKLRVNIKKDK